MSLSDVREGMQRIGAPFEDAGYAGRAMSLAWTLAALALFAQDAPRRVHDALFLRAAPDGRTYGALALDPPLYASSRWLLEAPREGALIEALDAMRASELAPLTPRARVVMQRDLWAAFDWVVEREPDGRLAAALARALRELRCTAAELDALRTDGAGLPDGLLDASHGWVRLADAFGRALTPGHDATFGQRSRFEVLLRLPDGRAATLAWMERLRALGDPRTVAGPTGHLRADLPQFPLGTEVALVRRALAIDERGELRASELVESVQLRRFLALDPGDELDPSAYDLRGKQEVAEFQLARDGARGLRALAAEETDFELFGTHGEDPFEGDRESWEQRKPHLARCGECHAQAGLYSLASFVRAISGPGSILRGELRERPSALVVADRDALVEQALARKRDERAWKALVARWNAEPR